MKSADSMYSLVLLLKKDLVRLSLLDNSANLVILFFYQ
jgi:hypothetical protein